MSAQTANLLRSVSNAAWSAARNINSILPAGNLPQPPWAPAPLPKSSERAPMTMGVPRRTLSLCPECNREAVEAVTRGESSVDDVRERPGIIAAEIIEEAGRILMRKACEKHGPFEDVLSNHPAFFRRIESLGFGQDFDCAGDEAVHDHGVNSIRTGRGTYLIVDLTNRCNMFCSPCYMDANGAGYVHELDMQDVTALFERARSFKPQREINVLFSGGEATLSSIFLDAVQHAKSVGFHRLHVATNGIRFAQERDFAAKARTAGLHGVYLQFDGVTDEKNSHRGIGNCMELKLRTLDNIAAAGMKTTLQVTVVNGLNNDGIGDIIRFIADHVEKIHGVILQPVMFCGRDEDISADERYAKRYPVSQIAYDLQAQTSFGWEPMRDWFPVSAYGAFAQLCDILHPNAELGSLFNDIHPNQGIFSPILVNARTKEIAPVAKFFNAEQFLKDITEIADSGRGPAISKSMLLLSLLRNFDSQNAPPDFGIGQLRELLGDCVYRVSGSAPDWSERAYAYNGVWRLVMVSPMAFQDNYNYDLSLISNSSTPVATQEGEINFCAYNGGRWRRIVEHLHKTASLTEWNRSHGRHPIYAKGKEVDMGSRRVPQRDLVQIDHQHTV